MGTIGQLDQNDTNIARHGEQHFAKRLCLVFFPRVELKLFKFGEAIDQISNWRAKPLNQFRFGYTAIFNSVVQQSSHQCLCVELPLRALLSYRYRMRDVRLAAVAELAQMRFIGKPVSAPDAVNVGFAQILELGRQRCKAGSCSIGGSGRGFVYSPRRFG